MRAFLDNLFKQLREFFGRMQKKDKRRLGILAVLVIALAIVVVSLLSRVNYVTLYNAQDVAEAGAVFDALVEMNESPMIEGTRVLVPEGKADVLKARLSNDGVLGAADFDRSLMESASNFSVTTEHARKLYEAQVGEYIMTQLRRLDVIQNAWAAVNLGKSSPFVVTQGVEEATAAVTVEVRGGAMLTDSQVTAIAGTVKGNVPGIKDENIHIVDSNSVYYPVGGGNMDIATEINSRIALQNMLQQQLKTQGEQLLTPIYGMSNLRVSVNILLDFDKRVSEIIEFFPPIAGEEDGIIRSSSELFENSRNPGAAEGVPGTDPNGMGTVEYPYGTLADGYEYARAVLEYNYEINQTIQRIEHEQGVIAKVEIGILLNSDAVVDDYTTEVTNLVSKGLGIAPGNIAVVHMRFSDEDMRLLEQARAEWEAREAAARRQEIIQLILKWAVILLLGLAFISLVRAIVRAIKGPEPEEPLLVGAGIDYIAGEDMDGEDLYEDVELQTKSSGLEQIERFIDKDPGAVAQLLRNWLTDD